MRVGKWESVSVASDCFFLVGAQCIGPEQPSLMCASKKSDRLLQKVGPVLEAKLNA